MSWLPYPCPTNGHRSPLSHPPPQKIPRPPVAWVLVPETGLEAIGWSLLVHQGQSLVFPSARQPVIGKPGRTKPPKIGLRFCKETMIERKHVSCIYQKMRFLLGGGRMGGVSTKPAQDLVVQCLGSFCLDFFCWRVFLEPNRLRYFGACWQNNPNNNKHTDVGGKFLFVFGQT